MSHDRQTCGYCYKYFTVVTYSCKKISGCTHSGNSLLLHLYALKNLTYFARMSVRLSVRLSVLHPYIHLSSIHLSICQSVRPTVRLSIHPTVYLSLSICPSIRPSVCLSVHLSLRLSGVFLSICLNIR